MTNPTRPTPIDEMFQELEVTPGVEFRPITDTDRQRVCDVFKALGVTDNAGGAPAHGSGNK
jgi:hypothetical protein